MCNCATSICDSCNCGQPCNCPPDYSTMTLPAPCNCCPTGYTYTVNSTYPSGICTPISSNFIPYGRTTTTIPCVSCEDTISTNCVTYNFSEGRPITCNAYGITDSDTLTTIINKMCITNKSVIEALLTAIGNDPALIAGFCHLVGNCGSVPGTSTPVIRVITFTIP